jgi:WASH complex subunit strumpellin
MEFLAPENDCGQTLLRLVSRGSAIIAELLRLSQNIPGCGPKAQQWGAALDAFLTRGIPCLCLCVVSVFVGPSHVEDPEQLKYLNILFDFAYLKSPEDFENMVNSNTVGFGYLSVCMGCGKPTTDVWCVCMDLSTL